MLKFIAAAITAAALLAGPVARAANYPAKPIKVIVPTWCSTRPSFPTTARNG